MIRVLRRQLVGDPTLLLVALVTALLVALTVGWPRALDRLVRDDTVAQAADMPPTQRDLTLTVPYTGLGLDPDTGLISTDLDASGARAVLEDAQSWTEEQVATAGPQLRTVLGPPGYEITRSPYFVSNDPDAVGISYMTMTLSVGPREDDLRLVEGDWPAAVDVVAWLASADGPRLPSLVLDVVVTPETARWMGWQVGEVRTSRDPSFPVDLRLSGLVDAVDPDSDVWRHVPGVLDPAVDRDDNAGWTVHGIGYVNPDVLGVLLLERGVELEAWYPVDPAAVGRADRRALAAELEGMRASTGLRTSLSTVLAVSDGRERAATTLVSVLIAGVVGVAAGALWLVATLAVERRREALVLLRARGASSTRLAALVGAQAALAVLPGAGIGLAAGLAVPGANRPGDLVLPGLLTVGAVAAVVVAGARVHSGRVGRDRPRSRWRWVGEVLVLAGTALALTAGSGSDPLVVALPVLVGLSAALVALRVYPWPARAALRATARRTDLGAFLGVARSARVPVAGLITVLALTLGVATAGLAVTTVSTVAAATQRSAVGQVGADLRLDLAWTAQDAGLTADQVEQARAVPGVAALAAVSDIGTVTLRAGRTSDKVHVWVVDGAALAEVQQGLPDAVGPLSGSGLLVAVGEPTGPVTLDAPGGRYDLEARTSGDLPGVVAGLAWAAVDRATWADAGGHPPVNRLLVKVTPGTDASAVADAITAQLDERLTSLTREQALARVAHGLLVTGVRDAMLLIAAASLLLVALVLGLVLVVDAPARARSAAVLATLGAPARVHRRLVVAEVAGPVLTAVLAGASAGTVLPLVVLPAADLRPFTGSRDYPPIVLDLAVLAAAGVGLAAVTALGVLLAVRAARRLRAVDMLRAGRGG